MLIHTYRRRNILDCIDLRTRELVNKLPGIRGEAIQISALSLSIHNIFGNARFPRSRNTRECDNFSERNFYVNILQIMNSRPLNSKILLLVNDLLAVLSLSSLGLMMQLRLKIRSKC